MTSADQPTVTFVNVLRKIPGIIFTVVLPLFSIYFVSHIPLTYFDSVFRPTAYLYVFPLVW